MAAVPLVIAAVSAAVSAVGAIRKGNAENQAGSYNATVQENAAATTRAQGTVRQEAQRERAQQVIGQQLAATSASGTGLSGSNLDALSSSLYNSELDALDIRYDSELNATGLEQQAALTRAKGKEARTAGYLSAASSLLNSSTSYLNGGGKLPSMPQG